MLKEVFEGRVRIGLHKFEFTELAMPPANGKNPEMSHKDSVSWSVHPDCLRVEFCRTVWFEPACNFTVEASYFVEHFLKEEGSLLKLDPKDIKKEIESNLDFYIQAGQGLIGKLSLLIAETTDSFGSAPLLLPPVPDWAYEREE